MSKKSNRNKRSFWTLPVILLCCLFVSTIAVAALLGNRAKDTSEVKSDTVTLSSELKTMTMTINSSNDIMNQDGKVAVNLNRKTSWIGNARSTTSSYLGLRFSGDVIPLNSRIVSATLKLTSSVTNWEHLNVTIAAEKNPNPLAYSTALLPGSRTPLTSSQIIGLDKKWFINTVYSFNVLKPVQELALSDGIRLGHVNLIVRGKGAAWDYYFFYNQNVAAKAPQLIIAYYPPLSSTTTTMPTAVTTRVPTAAPTAVAPTSLVTKTPTAFPSPTTIPVSSGSWWKPTASLPIHMQWQLSKTFNSSTDFIPGVTVYDIDGYDNSASAVAAIHAKGFIAICYMDMGGWEAGRPDSAAYPASVKGNKMQGWPEYYLDIRSPIVRTNMAARIELCRQKGFDALEPDVTDAYDNNSGFPLTYQDELDYLKFLANEAHNRGMSIGLKGDIDQAKDAAAFMDWTLNEECAQYGECSKLQPFVAANKAVFQVEYAKTTASFCADANSNHRNGQRRELDLGGPSSSGYLRQVCTPDSQNSW